ncbi:MAG: adenylate/guanylate cyclase domain-containing protein [Muribaculaceae bacterium]|nr:adenylate/guanylate cyclase domain-containing protein [Muribaculaceae bacterium]
MSLKEDILKKAQEIESEDFIVDDVSSVPTISNSKLTFGCKGLEFDATVLYIDMRGSTSILNNHRKRVVAKIHMLYYHAIVRIAQEEEGEIRSFNGDSLLVFFPGKSSENISNAVRAAMKMVYAINNLLNDNLKRYSDIDFGIGIDFGKILATKVGIGGNNETKDLIWIGNPVNKSTKISDNCHNPYNIGISDTVYKKLEDYVKYNNRNANIWKKESFKYNNQSEFYYSTNYYCIIN